MTLLSSAFAQETADVWLVLLTIDHPDLSAPIRVVNNKTDITSGGDLFVGFPFDIELPSDAEEEPPQAKLTIDNVSREIGQALRIITSPATVLMELILASDPDTIEVSWPGFILDNTKWDALSVSGRLSTENFTAEPYPAGTFSPAGFPGLF